MAIELEQGREAYRLRRWESAYCALKSADERTPLEPADLEQLAWSAALSGRDRELLALLERLHHEYLDRGEPRRAVRAAFWLGFRWMSLGEPGHGGGWLGRAARLLESNDEESAETGYMLIPAAHVKRMTHELDAAADLAARAAVIGEQYGEPDLTSFARAFEGDVRMRQGRVREGLALIDEAMVSVSAGDVSPMMSGLVFCSAIASCHKVFALDRAREWTTSLASWCDEQPELVTFTGRCLAHRSEALQLGGEWTQAADEARRACKRFEDALDPEGVGSGHYQQAEIHRMRGNHEAAEHAYEAASRYGHDPQPGLALLRLQQARPDAARAGIQRALDGESDPLQRARFLPAQVEIGLAADDVETAREACRELAEIWSRFDTDALAALVARGEGALALAVGRPREALEPLKRAFKIWHRLGAPFLAARVRVLLARAARERGDEDGARLEENAARSIFEELRAEPELAQLRAGGGPEPRPGDSHGLTPRQLEVLRLVARGETNKVIARELFISEKTVDRHVSNIFERIGVSTRSAATAFAYQNRLV